MLSVLKLFYSKRDLIFSLIGREISEKNKGALLGMVWTFIYPAIMLCVYTFVFSTVLKAKWSDASDSKTEFALLLFCGLMIFNFFSECLSKAPLLIVSNVNYVKKVIFPLEIMPIVVVGSAAFNLAISFLVWILFYVFLYGSVNITFLLFPILVLPYLFFILGMVWLLSALGVYFRDINNVVGIITTVLMFLSPIFYPKSSLPESFQFAIQLNPLTYVIEEAREVLFWGHGINIISYSVYSAISLAFCCISLIFFLKLKKGFADVL